MTYRFLIYISHTYALPIGLPLQEEIKQRNDEVKWFSELEAPKSYFPENGELLATIEEALAYKPHIVLCITDVVADFLPGLKVQIFHGFLANKHTDKKGHFRIRGLFDLYCTQGPSTTIPFKKIQQKKKHFLVRETGWSKVDPLFKIEENHREKPTILLSSTFSPKYSWLYNEEVISEIQRLSKTGEFKFLAVLHPKMDKDKIEIVQKMQHENFKYYDTTDIIPLFRQADIMFSDTTSAITEFILQKKPVVTFRNNKPASHLINISNPEAIESAIRQAFSPSRELLENIESYIYDTHPYFDGKSSERVISTCIEVLHTDKSELSSKPLNLVRRYQLRKKLNHFTFKSYGKPFTR
ncbi:MAG: CDP-glycerol glycerophosphotransferase [Zunongwangia sp.]|nr:CDP-glycerol glycerophosphotransferase [Zunongwangia sp.]